MAYLSVKEGEQQGSRIELDKSVVRIGRRDDNDGVLLDPSVSGSHCEIVKTAAGFSVKDLGSTNGTYVNNLPVEGAPLPVYRNDILKIGDVILIVEGDDVPENGSGAAQEPLTRTTLVIRPNRNADLPSNFSARSNGNKIWIIVIAILLLGVAFLAFQFFNS